MSIHSDRPLNRFAMVYGPWAVVTGASEGIGRAVAIALAEKGVNLVLVARRREVLEALAESLRSTHMVACDVVAADFSQSGAAGQIASAAADRDIGLLVASAGFGSSGEFLNADMANELAMIDVNCRAVAELVHLFGTRFVPRGRGGIVLLSSLLAFQGVPKAANYAATKAYVQVLAEGLRRELAPKNVAVLAVAPGPIDSGFARRAQMTYGMSQGPDVVARDALAALGRKGTVRPGLLSKLLEGSLSVLPRWGRTRVLQQIMAGMAK